MTTLKYPQFSYKGFELIEGSDIELEFTEKYLKYSAWSNNNYTDESIGMPVQKHWENIDVVGKDDIVTISYHYSNDLELFQVVIYTSDRECLCVNFKEQKPALKLQKQLMEWKFNNVMPSQP